MKVSIITPTHKNTPYIKELYQSILNQTYENWEWVIWVNGNATLDHLSFIKDDRVRILTDSSRSPNVGYHKHHAFNAGVGDILLEADHDDILINECLTEVVKAFSDIDVGFVYSDNMKLPMDGKFTPYNENYGWRHNYLDIKIGEERKLLASPITFKPTSHSMTYIWFMPDHVRCWRTSVYKSLGGHDINLDVLDDQDLIQRTYLFTKMFHIDKPLYIYRITGDNTWLERNQKIQTETVRMGYKNAQKLAERDAILNGKLLIDIGGGINKRPGYTSIDIEGGDIKHDLNQGIPLPDNSVGVINASHVLEHLKDPLKSISEIHRVLHHGGWAFIEVPSTDGRGAFQDPTHVSYWNENSFLYYYKKEQARYIRNTSVRFMKFRCETHFPSQWWKDMNIPVVSAWLVCLKDGDRFPGIIEI